MNNLKMRPMQILYHRNNEDRASYQAILEEAATERKLVIFCGSVISSYAPSDLPEGQRVTNAILRRLFTGTDSITHELRARLEQTTFEHVLEDHPDYDRIRATLKSNYAVRYSNPVHARIAELVVSKAVPHIITPNYDDGIEVALRDVGEDRPNVIACEALTAPLKSSRPQRGWC